MTDSTPAEGGTRTIQMEGNTLRFYQGVASASQVLDAHEAVEFPNHQARRDMFWFYAGTMAAGEHGCESQEDFSSFILGANTRAPQEPDADEGDDR